MVWSPFYTLKGPFECKDQGSENPEQGGPMGGCRHEATKGGAEPAGQESLSLPLWSFNLL